MNKYKLILQILFGIFLVSNSFSQNAGVSSLGSATACPGTIIIIPLNIANSPPVSAISLKIVYDAGVLSFLQNGNNSYGLINCNPALGATFVYSQTANGISLKQLKIGWSSSGSGVVIDTNGTGKLADIEFRYLGGSGTISFDNSSSSGSNCDYADSVGNSLNDLPTASYYINGQVSQGAAPSITGGISGNPMPCQGSYETYSVVGSSGVTYSWTAPATWTGTSTSNSITFFIGSFTTDTVMVSPSNLCGTGTVQKLTVTNCSTGIAGNPENVKIFTGNFPNPFRDETKIQFELPESGLITIDVYDIFGEFLFNVTNKYFLAGKHEVNISGIKLNDGIYPCRLKYSHNGKIQSDKIMMDLIK